MNIRKFWKDNEVQTSAQLWVVYNQNKSLKALYANK